MNRKILVAYFSCSGATKSIAELIAKKTKGDLYEIRPVSSYTSADLDWTNKESRSTIEMSNLELKTLSCDGMI